MDRDEATDTGRETHMSDLLKDSVVHALGPIFEDRASALTGLGPPEVRRSIEVTVSVLLAGLAETVRTSEGRRHLTELVRGPKVDPEFVERASLAVDGDMTRGLLERGEDLVGALFGARIAAVRGAIAEVARIDGERSGVLLALLTPFALTVVKRRTLDRRLGARGLARLLTSQASRADVDARLTKVVSTAEPRYLRPRHSRPARPPRERPARTPVNVSVWAKPEPGPRKAPLLAGAAILAIVAVGGWVLVNDDQTESGEATAAAEVTPEIPMTRSGIADLNGAFRRIALPDGRAFEAPAGGLADRLASHLRAGGLGEMRFALDEDVRFDPGTARIEPAAGPILDDVAGVLRAYPDARVRLESTAGDALAARRAEAVRNALIERGVAETRFDAPRVPDSDHEGIDLILRG